MGYPGGARRPEPAVRGASDLPASTSCDGEVVDQGAGVGGHVEAGGPPEVIGEGPGQGEER